MLIDGQKLENELARRQLNLTDFARQAGVSYTALWNIVKGKSKTGYISTVGKICAALDMDIETFRGQFTK